MISFSVQADEPLGTWTQPQVSLVLTVVSLGP